MKSILRQMVPKLMAPLAAVLLCSPALAQAPPSWTGCHVGLHVGYVVAGHDTDLKATGAPIALSIGSLSSDGGEIGGGAGCDMAVTGTPFVVGAFGEWTWRDIDHATTLTLGSDRARASFGIDQAWTVGARAGFVAHDKVLIYALLGYTQADSSSLKLAVNDTPVASFGLGTLKGWVVGGGFEMLMEKGWAVRGEYRHVRYDGTGAELIPGQLDLDMDTTEHVARLGAVYRFTQ